MGPLLGTGTEKTCGDFKMFGAEVEVEDFEPGPEIGKS